MFDKFLHPKKARRRHRRAARAPASVRWAGDTATVRRIVAKLEAMPPEQARFLAAAAYILARAANADMDISDDETAAIESELQGHESIDEATAVLVTEMAKLQAKTVGATEDYVVTREFKALVGQWTSGSSSCARPSRSWPPTGRSRPRRPRSLNGIAEELDIDDATLNVDPRRLPRAVLVGPASPSGDRGRLTDRPIRPGGRTRQRHECRPRPWLLRGRLDLGPASALSSSDAATA